MLKIPVTCVGMGRHDVIAIILYSRCWNPSERLKTVLYNQMNPKPVELSRIKHLRNF
uniref:Uncharacterized protein n=1 Tax=Anguilla anguilla TaxID=7936 RepID=A0A0E9T838_ANGAN